MCRDSRLSTVTTMRTLVFLVVSSYAIAASPLQKSVANNVDPQRYAILMEHFLQGEKNVRWETRPMTSVAGKGIPSVNGNVDCMDVNGQRRKEGEEYERASGKFKYKCVGGEEEVVACVGSERTGKARIPVGSNVEVNGFWHKCQSFENGSVVYFQEPSCRDSKGKEVHVGAEFTVGYLSIACDNGGYKTVGCVYRENGVEHIIREGETAQVGKYTHHCDSVNGNLEYSAKKQGCTKFEKDFKEGETLSENHLHYKCENGVADITGCYVDEHRDLKIGEDFEEKGVLHRCYRSGGAVEYDEYPCSGASCHPPAVPVVDEAPTLAHGLKAPGFGSFAIVQRIGGSDQVQSPSTLRLDLDRVLMGRQG